MCICGDSCLASVSGDNEFLVLGVGMYMLQSLIKLYYEIGKSECSVY